MSDQPTKAGKKARHCPQFPYCSHAKRTKRNPAYSFVKGAFGDDPEWRRRESRAPRETADEEAV